MNDKPPFVPFSAPPPMFETSITPAIEQPETPVKRQRRSTKQPAPVAPKRKRGRPVRDKHEVGAPAKRKSVANGKRPPKFELQAILRIASKLKEPDQKTFERFLGEMSAMPKPMRQRVLMALNEVFG